LARSTDDADRDGERGLAGSRAAGEVHNALGFDEVVGGKFPDLASRHLTIDRSDLIPRGIMSDQSGPFFAFPAREKAKRPTGKDQT
jgi:hypothetical protein